MRLVFVLLFAAIAVTVNAQGKIIEESLVQSKVMARAVRYTVYLPADYERSQRSYPVVYLLHGYTDDNTGWLQFGEINRLADDAIASGKIPPMIIVMPNADSSFYINSYDGKEKYEDFFINEFIPEIEKTYRIKSSKDFRAVAGLSMGGYGAYIYSLKHPDLFAAAAPLSAACWSDEELVVLPDASYETTLAPLYGKNLKGKNRLNKHWYANSPLKIVAEKSDTELKKVRYWIDCGDDDFLIKGNCLMHLALTDKKIPHEFRVRDGEHNWDYWRSGIIDALAFIGKSFHQ